jgi:hypothetical protein
VEFNISELCKAMLHRFSLCQNKKKVEGSYNMGVQPCNGNELVRGLQVEE